MTSRHETNWLSVLPSIARTFSTCAVRQYAAVVIDPENRVLALGYNGSPPGMAHCTDGGCPRALQPGVTPGLDYSSCTAQHAEAGALLWADPARRRGSTIVVSGPPCLECARLIASSGIRRCVFPWVDGYPDVGKVVRYMYEAGIEVDIPLPEGAARQPDDHDMHHRDRPSRS